MITALIQFQLPQPVTVEKAKEMFSGTAPKYQTVEGLIRKYYILSEDGKTAGGVYLWKAKEYAERLYTADWRKFVADKYGNEPQVTFFTSPVVVDNPSGTIIKD